MHIILRIDNHIVINILLEYPGVFTRISQYEEWIIQGMKKLGRSKFMLVKTEDGGFYIIEV